MSDITTTLEKGQGFEGNPNTEMIDEKEKVLAFLLKKLCTQFSKEHESTLGASSQVLLGLGIVYFKKAKETTGMLQKLTIIRCAALLNGAKVRFEKLGKTSKAKEAESYLEKLGSFALDTANAVSDSNLVEKSKKIFGTVEQMRIMTAEKIKRTPRVTKHGHKDFEKMKAFHVREVMKETTRSYKTIVKDISEICLSLLGPSPCKFAAVGLGSLARWEITPYSDYEHVLVLEEGAQTRDDYEQIKEYFRWYSVIFQLVIINFGETFIRSVGVKSLNDLYSSDTRKNWFYDNYTPCGMSFDGMAPHASSTPLGRQETTEKRRHVLELIKPVSEMANLLSVEEDLKNGYYVKDLLACTCFVNGHKEVYQDFENRIKCRMDSVFEGTYAEESISNNVNKYVREFSSLEYVDVLNVKESMYRPLVTLMAYLGRKYGFREVSTFEIVDKLHRMNYISASHRHVLRYTVAIVCEIRLKIYTHRGQQRHKLNTEELIANLGEQSFVDFLANMRTIFQITFQLVGLGDGEARQTAKQDITQQSGLCWDLLRAGLFEEAIKRYPIFEKSQEFLAICCVQFYRLYKTSNAGKDILEKCIDCAESVDIQEEQLSVQLRSEVYYTKAWAENELKRKEDCRSTLKLFFGVFKASKKLYVNKLTVQMLDLQKEAFGVESNQLEHIELYHQLRSYLRQCESLANRREAIEAKLFLTQLMKAFGDLEMIAEVYCEIAEELRFNLTKISEESVIEALQGLHSLFYDLKPDQRGSGILDCMEFLEDHQTWGNLVLADELQKGLIHLPFQLCSHYYSVENFEKCLDKCEMYLKRGKLTRESEEKVNFLKALAYHNLARQWKENEEHQKCLLAYRTIIPICRNILDKTEPTKCSAVLLVYGDALVNYLALCGRSCYKDSAVYEEAWDWFQNAPDVAMNQCYRVNMAILCKLAEWENGGKGDEEFMEKVCTHAKIHFEIPLVKQGRFVGLFEHADDHLRRLRLILSPFSETSCKLELCIFLLHYVCVMVSSFWKAAIFIMDWLKQAQRDTQVALLQVIDVEQRGIKEWLPQSEFCCIGFFLKRTVISLLIRIEILLKHSGEEGFGEKNAISFNTFSRIQEYESELMNDDVYKAAFWIRWHSTLKFINQSLITPELSEYFGLGEILVPKLTTVPREFFCPLVN